MKMTADHFTRVTSIHCAGSWDWNIDRYIFDIYWSMGQMNEILEGVVASLLFYSAS